MPASAPLPARQLAQPNRNSAAAAYRAGSPAGEIAPQHAAVEAAVVDGQPHRVTQFDLAEGHQEPGGVLVGQRFAGSLVGGPRRGEDLPLDRPQPAPGLPVEDRRHGRVFGSLEQGQQRVARPPAPAGSSPAANASRLGSATTPATVAAAAKADVVSGTVRPVDGQQTSSRQS